LGTWIVCLSLVAVADPAGVFYFSKGVELMRTILLTLLVATLAQAQPWQPVVIWDRSGLGEHSHFGTGVDPLGDQNEDGFDDWAVLSAGRADPGQENESRFDLFHGGNAPDTIPYMTFKGRLSPRRDFLEARVIGDVNGDGYKDWWTWNLVPGDTVVEVEVFFGGPDADTVADGYYHFPATSWDWMHPVGDINGDGSDDFYLYLHSAGHDETYFFLGGSPLDTIPDLVIYSTPHGPTSSLPRAFGDINGDGYGDFLTSNNESPPTAYLFLGGTTPDTVADAVWPGFYIRTSSLECDLNGDHRADLVTSWGTTLNVHLGRIPLNTTPDYVLRFLGCDNGAQWMESAGDFNDDGYEDMTAIDPACNLGFGGLKLYLGHPWLNPDPVLSIDGGELPLDLIGICHVAAIGDVNGDGIQDLAIGATNEMTYHEGQRGRVVILSGDTTLRVGVDRFRTDMPQDLTVSVYPNPFNGRTTVRFSLAAAGDVDVRVFDVMGREAMRVLHDRLSAGEQTVAMNASGLASGVYLLVLRANGESLSQKLLLIR
jgi:hypothetical protein